MVKIWLVRNEQRKLLTNIGGNIMGALLVLHVGGTDHQS